MNRRKFFLTMAAVAMVATAKTTGFADTVIASLGSKSEWSRVMGYDEEQDYTSASYTRMQPDGTEWHYLVRKPGDLRKKNSLLDGLDQLQEHIYQNHRTASYDGHQLPRDSGVLKEIFLKDGLNLNQGLSNG